MSKSIEIFLTEARSFPIDLVREKPTPVAFSATEIVYHMLAVEELWQRRMRGLLDGSSTNFVALDPDELATTEAHNMRDIHEGIEQLRERRGETLTLVSTMSDEDLALEGIHSKYGPMHILRILEIMQGHDRNHAAQLERTLSQLKLRTASLH